ncbi:serine hydrolase domain-containing protein [Chitinophaga caseinilytica]|uniref:serine hydrolase domain-containing protein n=1 Tax=Chitinophaga caseinilytica TaxID=2267521 RepID=UPI003C2E3BFC
MKILPILLAAIISLPVSAQLRQQRAAADSLFQHYNTSETTGISVLVVRNGKKLYDRSFGYADIAQHRKAAATTNYRIASVTKSFTAMAIMLLRDEGKLSLDDPLTRFFPQLAAFGRNITIRQMLLHTSGLVSYGDILPAPPTVPLKDADVLRLLETQDTTRFPPGSRFDYSNTGYVLLGLIVEKTSGMPFPEFLRQRIFQPLGMKNSTVNSLTDSIPNRAYGYNLEKGTLVPKDQSMFSYLLGDGGVYSSTSDFYRWDQALYTHQLVSAATLREIFTPGSSPSPTLGYGYGWEIDRKYGLERVMHTGGTSGFSSYYVRYPAKKFSIILFANQNTGLALDPIAQSLEKIFLSEAAGQP